MYYRLFQKSFKLMIPILPYREPKLLKNYQDLIKLVKDNSNTILVTDKGVSGLGLIDDLKNIFQTNNLNLIVFDEVVANPTTDNVEDAYKVYCENNCDMIIGFGGGSSIDLAKALGVRVVKPKKSLSKLKGVLKVRKKLPTLVAIPTTAGTGSETTLASVIVDSQTRHKYAINDFCLIPKYAILDANLILNLPKQITATTGMDALTHAIEAYIGNSCTKQTKLYALQAVKLIFENLLECYNNPHNFQARENMLNASYKAGLAFTKSYVGYVHAIAHSLGGKYNTAHGFANAIILPCVLRKYGKKIYKKLWELGRYANLFDEKTPKEVGAKIFIEKIEDMNDLMNIGTTIHDIKEEDIPELALIAEKEANPLYPVPVIYSAKQLEDIYYEVKNG